MVEVKGYNVSRGLKSVSVDGKTLLKHLNTKPFDKDYLIYVCSSVSSKLENMTHMNAASTFEQKIASIIINK